MLIKAVLCKPGEIARVVQVDNNLDGFREAIDCQWIEFVYPFHDKVGVICDDEGKLTGKPVSRALRYE